MAIRFYSWPTSSGTRVHWALEELGVPYEYVALDRSKNEHKAPAYLAINPNGRVPALVDDGVSYFESLAIVLHLAERYGVECELWPERGQDRADALSFTVWSLAEFYVYLRDYCYHGLASPISYGREVQSKAAGEFDLAMTNKNLALLDQRLADRSYICGSFTLADVCVGSVLRAGEKFGVSLAEVPNVRAYLERIGSRPALAKVR